MSDITLVQYDTAPSLYGTLSNITAEELAAAISIRFQMRRNNTLGLQVDALAAVASGSVVRYDWDENDLSMPGEYTARWQITRADGTIQHSEPENTITISPI